VLNFFSLTGIIAINPNKVDDGVLHNFQREIEYSISDQIEYINFGIDDNFLHINFSDQITTEHIEKFKDILIRFSCVYALEPALIACAINGDMEEFYVGPAGTDFDQLNMERLEQRIQKLMMQRGAIIARRLNDVNLTLTY
jgi:hypothetical protein